MVRGCESHKYPRLYLSKIPTNSHKLPLACSTGRPFLQKISLRPQESGLAARASHSAVSVDFPEASLSVIPCGLRRTHNCE